MRQKWIPTPDILAEVEVLVGQGMTEGSIALHLGIKPNTFTLKKREFPELADAVNSGKNIDESLCMNRIRSIAFNDDHRQHLTALMFYGKIRFGWNDRNDNTDKSVKPSKVGLNVIETNGQERSKEGVG